MDYAQATAIWKKTAVKAKVLPADVEAAIKAKEAKIAAETAGKKSAGD